MKKLFVIQKYILASSITEALKIENKVKPDEIWLDDDWKRANKPHIEKGLIGFNSKKNGTIRTSKKVHRAKSR